MDQRTNKSTDVSGEAVAPIPQGIKPREDPVANSAPQETPPRMPWTSAPILPKTGAGGAPLVAVIAVISALAALSLVGFVTISSAARSWTTDLSTSMTVQVKGPNTEQIEERSLAAKSILEMTPGIENVVVQSPEEAASLLEPWLGKGADGYLNIPALIEITVDAKSPPDIDKLKKELASAADGLSLDDHRTWNAALAATAGAGQALAFGIFLVVTGAACAIAVFAARAGLEANADIVTLLHLIGATDEFIATEVQKRFLLLGLVGSLIGVVIAALSAFLAGSLAGSGMAVGGFYEHFSTMQKSSPIMAMAIVPVAICIATAISARLTVLKALRNEF
ncbi:MAG: hypothetical protein AAF720_03935 [Pseudomonadota bacterium]